MLLAQDRTEDAARVLDELSQAARLGVGTMEFRNLLEASKPLEPVWEPEDILYERAALLESAGEYVQAALLLIPECHRMLAAAGRPGSQEDARAILEHIRAYGNGGALAELESELEALSARVEAVANASAAAVPEPDSSDRRVSVLFVGGDERQSQHQEWVLDQLTDRDPALSVEFLHPGWSGNWAPALADACRILPRVEGVVISRFIRTEFGRQLRKEIAVPWRACHGAGRNAMLDSILLTAGEARRYVSERTSAGG
jgi:hypothetical protein